MSDSIAKTDTRRSLAGMSTAPWTQPQTLEDAWRLAKMIAGSKMAPKHITCPEDAMLIMMHGAAIGIDPASAIQHIAAINGKPYVEASIKRALVLRSPQCEYMRLLESTGEVATWETQRVGDPPVRMSFSLAEAKGAGLTSKDNWRAWAPDMLRARASSKLCDAVYPDVTMGVSLRDEIEEPVTKATVASTTHPMVAAAALPTAVARPALDAAQTEPVPETMIDGSPAFPPDSELVLWGIRTGRLSRRQAGLLEASGVVGLVALVEYLEAGGKVDRTRDHAGLLRAAKEALSPPQTAPDSATDASQGETQSGEEASP